MADKRLNQTLEILALPVATVRNFDELPTPFRAVATDIATGQPRVLGQGDLATAIRASMSIPGVFVPVNLDGTLLVDGGSTMNLPVQAAQDMGADIIIAVDISTPLRQADQLDSAIAITAQTITMQIQDNTSTQINRLTDQDILLRPALPDIQTMSFNKVLEASQAGVEATQLKAGKLKKFSLSDEEWKTYKASRKKPSRALPIIRSLTVENNSSVSDSVLLSKINVPINEPLDVAQLQYDIDVLYGLDIFEIVEFEIQSLKSGEKELIIRVDDRLTGSNRIRFGVNLETDFETGSLFNIGISATRLPFNRLDAEWRNQFSVGEEPARDDGVLAAPGSECHILHRSQNGIRRRNSSFLQRKRRRNFQFSHLGLGSRTRCREPTRNMGRSSRGYSIREIKSETSGRRPVPSPHSRRQ